MELPSVKLNIFKKLEYFLVLKKLNKQFEAQFEILKKELNEGKNLDDLNNPSWEVEKKVLFWSYAYHKHLTSSLKSKLFYTDEKFRKDIFISDEEVLKLSCLRGDTEINHLFFMENLVARGFAKKVTRPEDYKYPEYTITKNGLAFGELLWYLYLPERGNLGVDYYLKRKLGYWILQLQLFSVMAFMIFAASFLVLEILEKTGLIDNLIDWLHFPFLDIIAVFLICFPLLVFIISLIAHLFYECCSVKNRYKKVEDLKK